MQVEELYHFETKDNQCIEDCNNFKDGWGESGEAKIGSAKCQKYCVHFNRIDIGNQFIDCKKLKELGK